MYSHPHSDYFHTIDSPADPSSTPYPYAPPPHLLIPHHDHHAGMEVGSSSCSTTTTSGCSSYGSPSSLATQRTTSSNYLQRSVSSHSLHKNGYHCHFTSPHDFFLDHLDSTSSVRRVFSTGDLQRGGHHKAESPLSSESSMIIESMSKACKYSPEEKKERIERYKSKRNQRNFTKKIKYVCRKTLADSRPRIRGRFARNDEIDQKNCEEQLQWSNNMMMINGGEEDEFEDEDTWINFLDAFSATVIP